MSQLVPIKAIPPKIREKEYLVLIDWLVKTLSLSGEKSADRIEVLVPMIEECAWSLSIEDIKKAFTLYVQGKLPIEPRDNYLTVILFSKVIEAFKHQRKVKPKELPMPEITEEEKEQLTFLGVVNCFDEFMQTNAIIDGYVWVYDHLNEIDVINYSNDEKKKQMPIARERLIVEAKANQNRSDYSLFIKDLEGKRKDQAIINKAKKMLLERFFGKIHAKGEHIKKYL